MSISKCPIIIIHTILKPPILNFILIIIVQQRWHPNCAALVEEVVEILRWWRHTTFSSNFLQRFVNHCNKISWKHIFPQLIVSWLLNCYKIQNAFQIHFWTVTCDEYVITVRYCTSWAPIESKHSWIRWPAKSNWNLWPIFTHIMTQLLYINRGSRFLKWCSDIASYNLNNTVYSLSQLCHMHVWSESNFLTINQLHLTRFAPVLVWYHLLLFYTTGDL